MRRKTAVLTVRVTPEVKKALKAAADRQRRSQANLLECLVLEHCTLNDAGPASSKRWFGGSRNY